MPLSKAQVIRSEQTSSYAFFNGIIEGLNFMNNSNNTQLLLKGQNDCLLSVKFPSLQRFSGREEEGTLDR